MLLSYVVLRTCMKMRLIDESYVVQREREDIHVRSNGKHHEVR